MTYTTYKRWRLNPGTTVAQVAALVADGIAPHYRTLSSAVALGLEVIDGERAVLATQRWPSRAVFDAAMSSQGFTAWWDAYQPILQRWNELVTFDDEWATEVLR